MLENLIKGIWAPMAMANLANPSISCGTNLADLASIATLAIPADSRTPLHFLTEQRRRKAESASMITVIPLLFNDPLLGTQILIPVGTRCQPVTSIEEARLLGWLPNAQSVAAAVMNLRRGYRLVYLQGEVRGVSQVDVRGPTPPFLHD